MNPGAFDRLQQIFLEARRRAPAERTAFLDDACQNDSAVRREVEDLLDHDVPDNDQSHSREIEQVIERGSSQILAETQLPVGVMVSDRYRIEEYLAAGGMGQVYRAEDTELGVSIALKSIRVEIASDPETIARFKQEVILARSVTHTNVCRIFDIGHDSARNFSFLTMEFLKGDTLSSRITGERALSPRATLEIARQLADALDAAHQAAIVHRDFKSANVMIVPDGDRERVVVTDFGLAVTQESDAARFGEGQSFGPGTPAYMSPEQARGDEVGPASDLYAFGVVLFEMCTGELPFERDTAEETVQAHLTADPPSPRARAPISEVWEEVILRLLCKDPRARFETAGQAVAMLEGRHADLDSGRHSLSAERDAFVGRSSELEMLASRLEGDQPETRLLTLQGHGGTGKTRLAQKYGWDCLVHWPGGAWFCDLSEARDLDGVVHAVAIALNVPLGEEDSVTHLGRVLARRGRALIILDNFEQVVSEGRSVVGKWLAAAPEASFLVTSRERLGVPGEWVYVLEPFPPATSGIEFFEVRARQHLPSFAVNASNREQVLEIVETLDGSPLAIELAASRLRLLGLEQLRHRLVDRFTVLRGGAEGRHETLRTTLDWSWDLLAEQEQLAVMQSSLFRGGFTLEAAESVFELSEHGEAGFVLDVLESLVDKSWLRSGVLRGRARFEIYSTVREYADDKLGIEDRAFPDQGRRNAVEIRHGTYFSVMGTDESIDSLSCHGGVEKLTALGLERENLTVACQRAIHRGDETVAADTYLAANETILPSGPFTASVELGVATLGAVASDFHRGRVLQGLAAAELRAGEMEEAGDHYAAALACHRRGGDVRMEGRVLTALGEFFSFDGKGEQSESHFEAGLALHQKTADRNAEGFALARLGARHIQQGRFEMSIQSYEKGLAIQREVGDRSSEGETRRYLGAIRGNQGRVEEARIHFEASLEISREVGNRSQEALARMSLGTMAINGDQPNRAREHFEAALLIHRNMGDRRFEGIMLGALANLYRDQNRTEKSRQHFESAIDLHREVGNRRAEGNARRQFAQLCASTHQFEEARVQLELSRSISQEVGDQLHEGMTLSQLASLARATGDPEEATEFLELAIDIHMRTGSRLYEATDLSELAVVLRNEGRVDEAYRHFKMSVSILRELEHPRQLGEVLCSFGELLVLVKDRTAAEAALGEAESIARELPAESQFPRAISSLRDSLHAARPGGDLTPTSEE